MEVRPADLPDYKKPPLIEVAFGVDFRTDPPLRSVDAGLYWERIKESFPKVEEQRPLPPMPESPLFMGPLPPLRRCWFLDEDGKRLVQLQSDRFMYNWRESDPCTGNYPHYEDIRDQFCIQWDAFVGFLQQRQSDRPRIRECRLTYLNFIDKGTIWEDLGDLPDVFTFVGPGVVTEKSGKAIQGNWKLAFEMPQGLGRLEITLIPALRGADQKETLRFALSTTRADPPSDMPALLQWFNDCRRYIVQLFTELTTKEAHDFWERTK